MVLSDMITVLHLSIAFFLSLYDSSLLYLFSFLLSKSFFARRILEFFSVFSDASLIGQATIDRMQCFKLEEEEIVYGLS